MDLQSKLSSSDMICKWKKLKKDGYLVKVETSKYRLILAKYHELKVSNQVEYTKYDFSKVLSKCLIFSVKL